eukprot:186746_1
MQYYKGLNKDYSQPGKFAVWADENGFDDDTLIEELGGDPEDATLLEFDEDFPLNKQDVDDKQKEILSILNYCNDNSAPPPTNVFDPTTLNLGNEHITEDIIKEAHKKYEDQSPGIYETVA